MRAILLALFLLATPASAQEAFDPPAHMNHSQANPKHWYPRECCHENDCAPAIKVERVDDALGHGRWVTSKHGRVWVADSKEAHHKLKFLLDEKGNLIKRGDGSPISEKIYTVPPDDDPGLHVCMRPWNSNASWELDAKMERLDPEKPMTLLCIIQEPQG